MHQFPRGGGWIEVICGSMFAGKTQELIRRLRLAAIARQKVQVFKHKLDIRFAREDLVSHDQIRIPPFPSGAPHRRQVRPAQVVGVTGPLLHREDRHRLPDPRRPRSARHRRRSRPGL
jgi:thymidine kinase